jgi:membrane associated rhomboid family serine protease
MIPYAVDASLDNRPVVNWIAFGGIIVAFIIKTRVPAEAIEPFVLQNWGLLGLVAHSWLHINAVHFVLNLLFLWPFGNAICGKIGNKLYIAVFLGFNLVGGILHSIFFSEHPAVAPCAAIAGLVGMYLVFFPENTIGCFFLVPRPVLLDVPGGFIIFAWFVADLVTTFWGVGAVTYFVHILSFASGIGLAVLMLKREWVTMDKDEKSLLQMLKREERKEQKPEVKEKEETEQKKTEQQDVTPQEPQKPKQQLTDTSFVPTPSDTVKLGEKVADNVIRFYCKCGRRLKVPIEYAGRSGRCPVCKNKLRIPKKSEPFR